MKPVLVPDEFGPRLFTGVAEAAAPAYLEQLARESDAPVTIILARAAKLQRPIIEPAAHAQPPPGGLLPCLAGAPPAR